MVEPGGSLKDLVYKAVILQAEGKAAEAEAVFRYVLKVAPDNPDALHFVGLAEYQKGRTDAALRLMMRAVQVGGDNPDFSANLGKLLLALGRPAEAGTVFRRALELAPKSADLHLRMAETHRLLGNLDEAEAGYRRALALDPKLAGAGNGLGLVLEAQGRTKEAEAVYRRTLKACGELPDVLYNLGNVLRDQHKADPAIAAYRRAIDCRPDFAEAHVHLAFALLLKGDFRPAWREYEWRWRVPAFAGSRRAFAEPAWDGGPLKGRTLLLYAEQGFGDTLQFARYAGVAAAKGGRVILECQPALARLMRTATGVRKAVAQGAKLPKFDCHAPLLGVPGLVGTTLKTVPADVPYLAAEPTLARKWRKKLGGGDGLKIGIAWRGTAERRGNPARACPLTAFRPFLADGRFRLFGLQKDIAAEDKPLPKGIVDLADDLDDFADTAAAVAALDLVVTIDTAVAHLAGALGKPTFLLLSTAGDWRWLTKRKDSPWYPSMRIFRQARAGEWAAVLEAAAKAARRLKPAKA
jgi:tetratricopeptide (TPR) repeat protein